jgi:hypothetical protein
LGDMSEFTSGGGNGSLTSAELQVLAVEAGGEAPRPVDR